MQSNRIESLDNLRVLATFAVILVHVSHPLTEQIHHQYWWISNLYDSSARFCVPIFLMISGSLLLNKQEDIKSFLSKRMMRILIPFLFWNTVYVLVNQYFLYESTKQFFGINEIIKAYLKGASFHFWYVYMILGLYLFIPFLTVWTTLKKQSQMLYFLGIWLITITVSCLPLKYQQYSTELPYFSGFVGYLILGYWLSNQNIPRKTSQILGAILFISGIAITYYATQWATLRQNVFVHQYYDYCTLNVAMTSIGLFLMVKNLPVLEIKILQKVRGSFAKFSYGIYLVHILVLNKIMSLTPIDYTYINPVIGILLTTCLCFLLSFFIVSIVNRLPYGNKISG
jgi:surface polysaccharide O-acyltransferase-like enzyme